MNRQTIYKYFNLVIKVLIGVTALGFIVFKLREGLDANIEYLTTAKVAYSYIALSLLLMSVNWGIETIKWQFLVNRLVPISFLQAFKVVLTGITVSIVTPNRIGEIPGRVFLLDETEHTKSLVWLTTIGSFAQLVITLVGGLIGLYFTVYFFPSYLTNTNILILSILVLLTIGLFLFFQKVPKMFGQFNFFKELGANQSAHLPFSHLLWALLLSTVRYSVFCLQYWLILKAFNIDLILSYEVMLIPVCFLVGSSIPTILLSEIGVRSSVAIFVFGMVSDNVMGIVLASLLLWTINIALPGLMGIVNLEQLKIMKA